MHNNYSNNEKELSDLFYRFIEQVHSIHQESNIKEMSSLYCFNLICLLQKMALIFDNKQNRTHIVKHRNHVIELCHFFEIFKIKELFKSKASLLINGEYKLFIEIAFDLLIKCYLQFPDEVIIKTIGYILHHVETKHHDQHYVVKENIWIYLDKLKTDELLYLSNEKHPRITDVNLSITFIIKVYKLIKQQSSNNKRLREYLTTLYDEIIEALSKHNQKSFFLQSKSKLYHDIVCQFEENIPSKIKLSDLKKNITNILEQYEAQKEITSDEYNCFKISKSVKLNREIIKRSVSNKIEIPHDINNNISTPPSTHKKRSRILSENGKKYHSSKNAVEYLLKCEKEKEEDEDNYNYTLAYDQTDENSSDIIKLLIESK
jgi:hypothetical protein